LVKKIKLMFGKPIHGWLPFNIYCNNILTMEVRCSGVFNPFQDYVDFIEKISKRNGKFEFIIEKEGIIGKIKVVNKNKVLIMTTETLSNRFLLRKRVSIINRKQFINELSSKLIKAYLENKKEMKNEFYDFSFDVKKLKNILRKNLNYEAKI